MRDQNKSGRWNNQGSGNRGGGGRHYNNHWGRPRNQYQNNRNNNHWNQHSRTPFGGRGNNNNAESENTGDYYGPRGGDNTRAATYRNNNSNSNSNTSSSGQNSNTYQSQYSATNQTTTQQEEERSTRMKSVNKDTWDDFTFQEKIESQVRMFVRSKLFYLLHFCIIIDLSLTNILT